MKYGLFTHKDHGDYGVDIQVFERNIEAYLSKVEDYLRQNKNNKVELKIKLWREFYSGDSLVEYLAEDHGLKKRTVYFHIDSVTSILKRHPDCGDMWRKI